MLADSYLPSNLPEVFPLEMSVSDDDWHFRLNHEFEQSRSRDVPSAGQLDAPLLTSSRCEALSKAFELQGGGQCALPLLAAYECMFSATEREEYPVEFFKADLHETFNATQQHGFLSLQEAIHFLEANQ